jgi:flagellar assembly protein FliH
VESQGAQVDGSLEKRWQRAVAALGLVSTWYEGAPHG